MKKLYLLLFAILAVTVSSLAADRTVRGQVVSAGDNEPVIGASVRVLGTNLGVSTDINGQFLFTNVPPTAKYVMVSYVGMSTQEVPIVWDHEMTIALSLKSEMLEEVVVTALGITRSEKSLGYSATQVGAAEIERAQTTNAMQALSGKVAGLSVQTVSSTPGSSTNVTIRGIGSINGSNQPLYVIDGVPMDNNSFSSNGNQMSTGGISSLSPDDIASMTVLKGAAATALYGSRASNGVIMITTKSGQKGDGKNYTITYSGNVVASRVTLLPEMQNEFGQGWDGGQTYIENGSWGPRLDGSELVYGPIYNNSQLNHIYSAKKNNMKDFFDTGWSQNHSVAISGVSKDQSMTYYTSYTYTDNNGPFPGAYDTYRRNAFSFRGSYQPEKWLKISSSVNYASYRTKMIPQYQGMSVIDGLLEFPRDISVVDLKDTSNPFNTPQAYYTPYGITNPYWALENNYDEINGNQTFGKLQVDIKPIDALTLSYRFGFNYSNYDNKFGIPQVEIDASLLNNTYGYDYTAQDDEGEVYAYYRRANELNHDFLANYTNKFLEQRLDVSVTAGVTINERNYTYMSGQTNNLSIYTGFWQLSNGSSITSLAEGQMKRRQVGLYGDVNVGWDDYVFLGVTARNDWSSTLPKDHRSYFYPGVTLSGIFSKFIPKNEWFTFGKVRLAYGKTGADASPYYTSTNFIQAYNSCYYTSPTISFPISGVNSFMASATAGSTALKPEMTSEFEAGLNMRFVDNRIELDAAFYNRITKDQIFTLPVDPSTGYSYQVVNFGKVRNRGVELMLNLTPVLTKDFRWDLSINWAKNWNKVLSMPESLEGGLVQIASYATTGKEDVRMYAEVGKPLGTYYTYMNQYVTDPESPYYGALIVDEYGQPVLGNDLEYTGMNMNHKWTGGITTSFSAFGFTLSGTVDIRYGGYMFTRTADLMYFTGNGTLSTYNHREPFVIPNSVVKNADGTYSENTTPIYLTDDSMQSYYSSTSSGLGGMASMINRTYAKLRNISLTWQVPQKWVRAAQLSQVDLTLYGNNLYTWRHKSNLYCDPETATYTANGDIGLGFGQTYYANPSAIELGVNLKVTF